MFVKVQTSRVKLKQIISSFEKNAVKLEVLVAPRPLPKQNFQFYVAFASVKEGSENHKLLQRLNNYKIIAIEEFQQEINAIEYYWVAGDKNVNGQI